MNFFDGHTPARMALKEMKFIPTPFLIISSLMRPLSHEKWLGCATVAKCRNSLERRDSIKTQR
jgi:hypothetical protein